MAMPSKQGFFKWMIGLKWTIEIWNQSSDRVPLTIASHQKKISENVSDKDTDSTCDIVKSNSGLSYCMSGKSFSSDYNATGTHLTYQPVLADCKTLVHLISLDSTKLSEI
eukprot:2617278-Ditylum_brightwellii.AAC.1